MANDIAAVMVVLLGNDNIIPYLILVYNIWLYSVGKLSYWLYCIPFCIWDFWRCVFPHLFPVWHLVPQADTYGLLYKIFSCSGSYFHVFGDELPCKHFPVLCIRALGVCTCLMFPHDTREMEQWRKLRLDHCGHSFAISFESSNLKLFFHAYVSAYISERAFISMHFISMSIST